MLPDIRIHKQTSNILQDFWEMNEEIINTSS